MFHPVLAGLAEAVYSRLLRKQHGLQLVLKRQTDFGRQRIGIYTKATSDLTYGEKTMGLDLNFGGIW